MSNNEEATRKTAVLTLSGARTVLREAVAYAADAGLGVTVVVSDGAGLPIAVERLDGAPRASVQVAQDKAFSAASTKTPTAAWYGISQDDPEFGYGVKSIDRLTPLAGGLPLFVEEELVGAIGVSGGSNAEDLAVAESGAAALS